MIGPKMATSTFSFFYTVVVLALLVVLCSAGESCTQEEMNAEHLRKLATANNEFALNLHRELAAESSENIFFSPFSISTAFGMLFYGARGSTAEELRTTLGYTKADLPDDLVPATFHQFLTEVLKSGDSSNSYVLNSANALLLDKYLKTVPGFKSDIEDLYQATVRDVDFQKSEEVVQGINAWVKDKTNGKIEKLLDELQANAVMVILNAIYFKGTWKIQFNPDKTRPRLFYNNGLEEQAKDVPLMHMSARFRYTSLDDLQALELPYKGENISMILLLPNERNGLAALEESLTLDKFNTVLDQLFDTKVILAMPKFKAEFSKELSDDFKSLGASEIFQAGSADFSGMSPDKNIFVSQVLHKAVVEVNEEGSEAAAVTGIVSNRMRPIFDFVPEFRADHPFLYFIVEQGSRSDMILFMGRVNSL